MAGVQSTVGRRSTTVPGVGSVVGVPMAAAHGWYNKEVGRQGRRRHNTPAGSNNWNQNGVNAERCEPKVTAVRSGGGVTGW